MSNESSSGAMVVQPQATTVQPAPARAAAAAYDPGLLSAARDLPNVTDIRQENGRVVVTTHGGGKIIVSRDPDEGHVILTPAEVVSTEAHASVSPAEFMPPEYVVNGAVTVVAMVCSTFLIVPILSYLLRRRERKAQSAPVAADPQIVQRLARIEESIEAIAIEVERSAEAQRYSARLLTERMLEPAVPASATTESLAIPRRAAHARD